MKTFPITWFLCNTCQRATTTALCGCAKPDPVPIAKGEMRVQEDGDGDDHTGVAVATPILSPESNGLPDWEVEEDDYSEDSWP